MADKKCPSCHSSDSIREVIYGLPDSEPENSRFVVGGCCISEKDPTLTCLNCGWEGEFINNIEVLGLI